MAPLSEPILIVSLLSARALAYLANGTVVIPGATSYNGLNLVPQMGWDSKRAHSP
jgi:alpha-galactosidase